MSSKRYFSILAISLILFLTSVVTIYAAATITILSIPLNKIAGEEFEVSFSASGLSNSASYFMKGLGGDTGTTYTEVDTWNGSWNQQNASWSSMPTFTSNPEGSASATIKVRFDPSSTTNSKDFFLRIRKSDDDTNIDSVKSIIQITAATPSPTLVPTAAPTNSPTSTPSPTKSPTPQPTLVATVKPSPTKTPTPKPTEISEVPTAEPARDTESLLATQNEVLTTSTPTGKVLGKSTENRSRLLALFLFISGALFLGYGGFLLYNQKHVKN